MKLSFKKQPKETGLASCARPHANTDIKADGKKCGVIEAPSRFGLDQWSIRIMNVKEVSLEEPAPFKWVTFKARFDAEPAARVWIKDHWAEIEEKFNIYAVDK